jgi:hypothetical protein
MRFKAERRAPLIVPHQLFDHLVGAQHDRWGYGKAKRLGGLEVQDHLELGRNRPFSF